MGKLQRRYQRGQALIEFAIVLILIIMVVAGGAELAIAAYHASKTGDGAKAAANDWANAVSFSHGVLLNKLAMQSGETPAENDARHLQMINDLNLTTPTLVDCSSTTPPVDITELPLDLSSCNLSNTSNADNLVTKLSAISDLPQSDFSVICTDSIIAPTHIINCANNPNKYLIAKPMTVNKVGEIKKTLGNHNPINFSMANCNGVDYDNGLPDQVNIYLFNPLPIDITNCDGSAGKKVDELIAGTDTYEGMPKLNLALRSQYQQVCVSNVAGVITLQPLKDCVANGNQLWLKPPGKMCGAGTAEGTEYCPNEGDLNGATGFYFFGDSNISGNNLEYIPTSFANPEFRPTFQLVCGGADYRDSNFDAADECSTLNGAFSVQVNTRYRSIFESFLTFGLQAIPVDYINGTLASLLPYFYNPNQVGASNQLVGTAGSEIGPIGGKDKTPTVKRFRDFRGCYHVDIIPPDNIGELVKTTVSACN
ncbi:MAG: hypothetical protein CVU29_10635 [Betaproteobacteria bacterium HGW-Betaproteobacteria-22]|nr:MAG: hypothetical protein CVU29_10635 [Betaproteobacteria bacterium HGW-Betaproteobacteria-22]